jgi:transcriptional regulator with XRE-family HTH domain
MDKQNTGHLSPTERGKRLKLLRHMAGLSIKELSKKHKIGESTIKYWEYAQSSGLSEKGARKIIEIMKQEEVLCTFQWLMYGTGSFPQPSNVTINKNSEFAKANEQQIIYEKIIQEEKLLFSTANINTIILDINDDTMDPVYVVGDSLGGIKIEPTLIEKFVGQNCIIELTGNEFICRLLSRGSRKNLYGLSAINPHTTIFPPILHDISSSNIYSIVHVWKKWPFSESL